MGPPAKPGQTPQPTPNKTAAPASTTASKNNGNTPADVPAVTPLKRGPGRPRKSEKVEPTAPPPAKRLRGRPRNSTAPAANTRQRARDEAAEETEDGEYQDSDESTSENAIPPNILAQYTAHVSVLRTKLDSRGIPEQYSIYKSFWVPVRSMYFDGGASAPPNRFVYWDPLFITSVGCPVCQQPLAIAAGGGWLDEPLSMRDNDGPCWIIGRRYVCTQCFAANEVAARYVDSGHLDRPHGDSDKLRVDDDDDDSGESKAAKVDFSSPVYYLSWEKRFRDLLPAALAEEFPTRVKKRAVKEKEKDKEKEQEKDKQDKEGSDEDIDGDDGDEAETPKRSMKRARHCMKCGFTTCQGRMGRSRCPSACYDCGSTDCNGRPKSNITCKGEVTKTFKELNIDESGSPLTEISATSAAAAPSAAAPAPASDTTSAPAPDPVSESAPVPAPAPAPPAAPAPAPPPGTWPVGLPEVPPGFVLAIPYAIGVDGKPGGAGPGMAYLVPKNDIPGFLPAHPLPPAPAPASKPDGATASTETSSSAEPVSGSTPATGAPSAPAQPAQPAPKKNPSRAKATPQKAAAAAAAAAQQQQSAPAPTPPRAHHPYPPPPGVPYHPHPPPHHSHPNGPESGYYGGYYAPYGYPPPYGFGFYAPYPPQHQPHGENGPQQQPHPPPTPPGHQSHYYPGQSGYAGPQSHPQSGYGPPQGPYAPPPDGPGPNGYGPPPPGAAPGGAFHQQPQQYIAYQPHVPVTPAPGPATKKRKTGPAAAESDKT